MKVPTAHHPCKKPRTPFGQHQHCCTRRKPALHHRRSERGRGATCRQPGGLRRGHDPIQERSGPCSLTVVEGEVWPLVLLQLKGNHPIEDHFLLVKKEDAALGASYSLALALDLSQRSAEIVPRPAPFPHRQVGELPLCKRPAQLQVVSRRAKETQRAAQ